MKISIALYVSNPAEDKVLYQNLIKSGIRVCKIGDISRLHTILESHTFDSILINSNFFAQHALSASRHLWNARSAHTILCWTKNDDSSISGKLYSISPEISGLGRSSDYSEKIDYLLGVLSGINRKDSRLNQENQINQGNQSTFNEKYSLPQQKPVVHISEELHLHKKIRLILEYLINSGETGMDSASLIEKIWGKPTKNRTKDLQSYISKLRGILTQTCGNHCQISYCNKRYYLLNIE